MNVTDLVQSNESVVELTSHDGSVLIYLVGTCHVLPQSAELVVKIIKDVQPHILLVEASEEQIEALLGHGNHNKSTNNSNLITVLQNIEVVGPLHYLLLRGYLRQLKYCTQMFGCREGYEMVSAVREAKKVPHCELRLADCPNDITMGRLVAANISLREKIVCLFYHWFQWRPYLIPPKDPKNYWLQRITQSSTISMAKQEAESFKRYCPEHFRILVDERDQFMCRSIWDAVEDFRRARKKGVMEESSAREQLRVVAVIGSMHVAGVVNWWQDADKIDLQELQKIPEIRMLSHVKEYCVLGLLAGLPLYGGYRALRAFLRRCK